MVSNKQRTFHGKFYALRHSPCIIESSYAYSGWIQNSNVKRITITKYPQSLSIHMRSDIQFILFELQFSTEKKYLIDTISCGYW